MPGGKQSFLDGFNPEDPKHIGLALVRLDGALVSLANSASNASQTNLSMMADLRSEIRQMSSSVDSLRPIAQTSADTRTSIDRLHAKLERMEQDRASETKDLHERITLTKSRVDKISFVAMGISIAIGIMSGMMFKTVDDNDKLRSERMQGMDTRIDSGVTRDNNLDDRLDRVELHMAGDPDRPYRR